MNASNSSGEVGVGVAPCVSMRSLMSGRLRTRTTSRLARLVTGRGVFADASSPYHWSYSNPGIPPSATVGRSGNIGERCAVLTASASTLPALTSPCETSTGENVNWTRPVMASFSDSTAPL